MHESNKCPNCSQYKIERRNGLTYLIIAIGVCAIFIITLPFEIILIPMTIVAAFMPSMRATFRYCRNCKWNDKPSSRPATN